MAPRWVRWRRLAWLWAGCAALSFASQHVENGVLELIVASVFWDLTTLQRRYDGLTERLDGDNAVRIRAVAALRTCPICAAGPSEPCDSGLHG